MLELRKEKRTKLIDSKRLSMLLKFMMENSKNQFIPDKFLRKMLFFEEFRYIAKEGNKNLPVKKSLSEKDRE